MQASGWTDARASRRSVAIPEIAQSPASNTRQSFSKAAPELTMDLHFCVAQPNERRVAAAERSFANDGVQDRFNVLGQVLDQQRQAILDAPDHLRDVDQHMAAIFQH